LVEKILKPIKDNSVRNFIAKRRKVLEGRLARTNEIIFCLFCCDGVDGGYCSIWKHYYCGLLCDNTKIVVEKRKCMSE
jgi:hypothetical protein